MNCQQIQQEENLQEQERLRKEALLVAERERHKKYRRQDEEREVVRQRIRDKVLKNTVTLDTQDKDFWLRLSYEVSQETLKIPETESRQK